MQQGQLSRLVAGTVLQTLLTAATVVPVRVQSWSSAQSGIQSLATKFIQVIYYTKHHAYPYLLDYLKKSQEARRAMPLDHTIIGI
jgi:hypothetical protein